jgi:allene oxide cyclase-like protein
MRRRWKRRLLWAAVFLGVLLLAIPATVAQATDALTAQLRRRTIMRKLIPIVAVLAITAALGSGALATASSTGPVQTMSLTTLDIPNSEVYVDAGPKGESVGDTVAFRETILRHGKKAGTISILCVATSSSTSRCWGTMRISGGTLDAAGDVLFAKTFSLPVVGGTGAYAGAKGELTITQLTKRKDRYVIELAD